MSKYTHILYVLCGLALAGCTAQPVPEESKIPVLFTVGSEDLALTKASVPYMPENGHFVCAMYFHASAQATPADEGDFDVTDPSEGGTLTESRLTVNNALGNAVYADDAPAFYWNNRMTHAFVALANNNKLDEYPAWDATYDLTRGSRTSMSEQPDPILALTLARATGSLPEANRVRLYFKHQFSQVQVNLKAGDDNSAQLEARQIDKVELLGVSEEAYVPTKLQADGTLEAPSAKIVKLDEYSDAQLKENKWGTSLSLFEMEEPAMGYLKSFHAITFGTLWAIRITWHEEGGSGVVHVSSFEPPEQNESHVNIRKLASGMRYVYDLEIRRGMLAVIRAEIKPWAQKEELVYGADGTITN